MPEKLPFAQSAGAQVGLSALLLGVILSSFPAWSFT